MTGGHALISAEGDLRARRRDSCIAAGGVSHLLGGGVSCLKPKYQDGGEASCFPDDNPSDFTINFSMSIWENTTIFTLPGQGEQTNANCGAWRSAVSCPDFGNGDHDRFVIPYSCHNPDCPICNESWASRQADKTNERFMHAYNLYLGAGYHLGMVKHFTFSPPPGLAAALIRSVEGYRDLKKKCYELLKYVGCIGGAVVFHPFRQNDPREPNFDPDLPAYVWYVSPHFHVVGYGFLLKSDNFFRETGWVYKQHERRETLRGTVKYLLSHCGIRHGMQALCYFGLLSNNKIVIDKILKTDEPLLCQKCGKPMHEFAIRCGDECTEVDWTDDQGEFRRTVIKRTYKLRVKGVKSKPVLEDYSITLRKIKLKSDGRRSDSNCISGCLIYRPKICPYKTKAGMCTYACSRKITDKWSYSKPVFDD